MYICTRHFPARNRTRRISSADHREQIRYIRSSFVECGYKFGAEEREREKTKQKKKVSFIHRRLDENRGEEKKDDDGARVSFVSKRIGHPTFRREPRDFSYSRRKDEADIVAVSSRRFARCFAYRVSRVCVHATRTYLFFSPVHRVNGDSS